MDVCNATAVNDKSANKVALSVNDVLSSRSHCVYSRGYYGQTPHLEVHFYSYIHWLNVVFESWS